MREKTVLLIPGYTETRHNRNYAKVMRALRAKGYRVRFVPIEWAWTTLHDWMDQLNAVYKKYDPRTTILAGFSFGAMTALMVAAQRPPARLWLFSLSPYFTEFIGVLPQWVLRFMGKKRVAAFRQSSLRKNAQLISAPTLLFYGSKEAQMYPELVRTARRAQRYIPRCRTIIVPDTKHNVTADSYIAAIVKNI